MLTPSNTGDQTSFFGTDLLLQLDANDLLIQLSQVIPWSELVEAFAQYYSKDTGASSKPIRLMVGLLLLKQLESLSDEKLYFISNTILIPQFSMD